MNIWKINNYEDFYKNVLESNQENIKLMKSHVFRKVYYQNYFEVNKKVGKRRIYSVNSKLGLYKIQKNLNKNFLGNVKLADCCYGFRKGHSYFDFLVPHKAFYNNRYFLRLDIKDFFGSIKYDMLYKDLSYYYEESEDLSIQQMKDLIDTTLNLVTYRKKVLQGAVNSPIISNIFFRQLDLRIEKYCNKVGVVYTRYADDLLFSSYNSIIHKERFHKTVSEILKAKGFTLNSRKKIMSKHEISLNGYVINDEISLSRKKLSDLNRTLFYIESHKWKSTDSDYNNLTIYLTSQGQEIVFPNSYSITNYLTGYRAFIINCLKVTLDQSKRVKLEKTIERIEKIVLLIDRQSSNLANK